MRTAFWLTVIVLNVTAPVQGADWPLYRGDSQRSAHVEQPFALPLALAWKHQAPLAPAPAWPRCGRMMFDRDFQVVAAGDRVLFGSSADGTVTALHAATGEMCWRFFTEGPVRFAPALWHDRALVASDDGWLYAIRLSDGELLWKFRGGPSDSSVLGNETMISRWPARGGPVVSEDTVYFAAGIWPSEGIYVYALNASSGDVIWKNVEAGAIVMAQPHPTAEAKSGLSAQGYLVVSGEHLLVPTGRAVPACLDRRTGAFQYFHLQKYGHNGGALTMVIGDVFFNGGLAFDVEQGNSITKLGTGQLAATREGIVRSFGKTLAEYTWQDVEKPDRKGEMQKVRELVARWSLETENAPESNVIATAGGQVVLGGRERIAIIDGAERKLAWEAPIEGVVGGLAVCDQKLLVSTDRGAIYCFSFEPAMGEAGRTPPAPPSAGGVPTQGACEAAADAILQRTGVTEGYCLDLGCGTGELALALAQRSTLRIVAVDPDPENVRRARETLSVAGLYGTRVVVQQRDLATTGYPAYFADLIVSRRALEADLDPRCEPEAARLLRPHGGIRCVGRASDLLVTVRGPLEGAGNWTHQYADPANTVNSGDALLRGTLGMLWFRDVNFDVPSRHGRAPAPLVHQWRIFHEGLDGIIAVNAYNGRELWRFPLPNVLKAYHGDELMGVAGTGSNMCVGGDHLYVRCDDRCLQLDIATGKQTAQFSAVPPADGVSRPVPLPWGYLAWSAGVLFGSSADPEHVVTFRFVDRGGDMTRQLTESKNLFAIDTQTGTTLWSYQAQNSLRHNAIAIAAGRLFAVDRPAALSDRVKKPESQNHPLGKLVALDVRTGQPVWENADNIYGTVLAASERHGVLLMSYQPTAFRLDSELGGRMAAFRLSDGTRLWDIAAQYGSRPTINDRTVYVQGGAWDLLTGEPVAFQFQRSYGCGILTGAQHMLLFRSATLGYYDLAGAKTTENYGGIRPGCWINAIPAGGMVLLPDATAGCECSYLNKAWIALAPLAP
ncbi:MAG: outer membrane protein assembly factor BamB family protein [Pirellulaceae bacterium]